MIFYKMVFFQSQPEISGRESRFQFLLPASVRAFSDKPFQSRNSSSAIVCRSLALPRQFRRGKRGNEAAGAGFCLSFEKERVAAVSRILFPVATSRGR